MITSTLGIYWHAILFGLAGRLRHPQSAVNLDDCRQGVQLHYHGLGGGLSQRVVADDDLSAAQSPHAGMDLMAWLEQNRIRLPLCMNRYPDSDDNREFYFWIAAFLAADCPGSGEQNYAVGVRHLLHGVNISNKVIRRFPGLRSRYQRLCAAELTERVRALPKLGDSSNRIHALEAGVRFALGSNRPTPDQWLQRAIENAQRGELSDQAPMHWCRHATPILPVPLWGRPSQTPRGLTIRFLKRNRRQKLRQQQNSTNKLSLEFHRRRSRPLDERTDGRHYRYPEWDGLRQCYRPDWCTVIEHSAAKTSQSQTSTVELDDSLSHSIRRQFEALRASGGWLRFQVDGEEIDIESWVDGHVDRKSVGTNHGRFYRRRDRRSRDLSVAILIDISRSTDSLVEGQRIIDIARQSMVVLAGALQEIGDDFALYGFSSDSRHRVTVHRIKSFDGKFDEQARQYLHSLSAANYTRMGAAIRHLGKQLQRRASRQKLMLILTDGQPVDPIDQYVGTYALHDCRRALQEVRQQGIDAFGLTIDRKEQHYQSQLFKPGSYLVYSQLSQLPQVLPRLYARITGLTP